jgi:hypothetical protein
MSDGYIGLSPSSRRGLISFTESVIYFKKYKRNSISYLTYDEEYGAFYIGSFNTGISSKQYIKLEHYAVGKSFSIAWGI